MRFIFNFGLWLILSFLLNPYPLFAETLACHSANALLRTITEEADTGERLIARLEQETLHLSDPKIAAGYCRAVADNLKSKTLSKLEGVNFSEQQIVATAILFERFRIETYITSGVAPKRYFGFFDGKGKTGTYELRMLNTARESAQIINDYAAAKGITSRITEKEVVVTFLAEGGALLLTDEFSTIDRIHPVRHVGLDNYRRGFALYPELLELFDLKFKTKLRFLSISIGGHSTLLRPMTFVEAVLGTAAMYFYEKELAEKLRKDAGLLSLMSLPLDEQFVHTSFVYNSGILFEDKRVAQVMAFDTAEYLISVNSANVAKRAALPVESADSAKSRLSRGEILPQQLTNWSAMFHILQRYGAWVALNSAAVQ